MTSIFFAAISLIKVFRDKIEDRNHSFN